MKNKIFNNTFPVERARILDSPLRKWMTKPAKIVKRYVSEEMTVLDFGCGPGVFSLEIAKQLNGAGKVIAADMQQGMLDIVKNKIAGKPIEKYIELHKCDEQRLGIKEPIDFILACYVIHEVSHQRALFEALSGILKPNGKMLIVEPKLHVIKEKFNAMLQLLNELNWKIQETSGNFFNRAVTLTR